MISSEKPLKPSEKLLKTMLEIKDKYALKIAKDDENIDFQCFEELESVRPQFEKIGGIGRMTDEFKEAAEIHKWLLGDILDKHEDLYRKISTKRAYYI